MSILDEFNKEFLKLENERENYVNEFGKMLKEGIALMKEYNNLELGDLIERLESKHHKK